MLNVFRILPTISETQSIVTFNPPKVTVSEHFESAKQRIDSILTDAGQVTNAIQNRGDLENANIILGQLRQLLKNIELCAKPAREALSGAITHIDAIAFALDSPVKELISILSQEIYRYNKSVEDALRAEEEKKQKAAAREQEKIQRQAGLLALRDQVTAARQAADNAERFGSMETATEIRRGIQQYVHVDINPDSFTNPHRDALEVRKIVALALQHELEKV